MKLKKSVLSLLLVGSVILAGMGQNSIVRAEGTESVGQDAAETQAEASLSRIDMTRWQYNEETDVY